VPTPENGTAVYGGVGLGQTLSGLMTRVMATVRAQLGEAGLAPAWRAGRQFSLSAARREVEELVLEVAPGGAAGAARPVAVEDLTRRERDVLRLLAEFMSDQEIAEELYLSQRTVNWHVRSILGKLEVGSRREATARAQSDGLV
jgi:DNA-binding NarL/FixJ family response regulator